MSAPKKWDTPGPWDDEPDELNFDVHGLKCAMRRGPCGNWCGYVGISEGHPWHGKDYSDSVKVPEAIVERPLDVDKVGVINIFCAVGKADAIADGWMDIVLAVDAHGGLTYSRDHEPFGEPDGLWWFGFDCGHSGDETPKYANRFGGDVYRDQAYVETVCRDLAAQLVAVGEPA